jgi:uncharacterized protein
MEHKVEDLLASIRKAMDGQPEKSTTSLSGEARGTLMRGALREMRVNLDKRELDQSARDLEVAELRERILRNSLDVPPMAPPAPARRAQAEAPLPVTRDDFRRIMETPRLQRTLDVPPAPPPRHLPDPHVELRPAYEPEDTDDINYQSQAYEPFEEDTYQPRYEQAPPPRQQAYARQSTALVSPATEAMTSAAFEHLSAQILGRLGGDRFLEDTTREMLRGMLKQWLDENLPRLVEDLVREEIERVARRGR